MSLILQTNKAPIPFEPDRGLEVATLFADVPENIFDLINGVAGCSPYLRGLITSDVDWLSDILAMEPDAVLQEIKATCRSDSNHLARDLRRAKRRVALYTALADVGGMWSLSQVTTALTSFADHAVNAALSHLMEAEFARGRLPGCTAEDLKTTCGMVVLAMGKMGANELNYSSDIDLIVLFDETRHSDENFEDIRERFIRITKRMTRMLSDVTRDGYVFRTDLRLRPDPSVTPVCLSMAAAERYYESLGRTWERAAYIKARPCAGDIQAGWEFLETLRPFVWRKHLDYAAIQDAHDMRLAIRAHKRLGGAITLPGHNMKLGRGGIREIEFFTQTRQIIAGGRDVELRSRETVQGLMDLAAKDWISQTVADQLAVAYEEHRRIEHRIQMLNDAQTHDIPASDEQISRLARFSGFGGTSEFRDDVISRLEAVNGLIESFFEPASAPKPDAVEFSPTTLEMIDRWRSLPALRTARAGEIFKQLQPLILTRVGETVNPEETLKQFDGFLAGLPAGVQLFSLFKANPHLIDLLVDICGSAPGLAHYLSRNSGVFDAVIGGVFFEPLPGVPELVASLDFHLAGVADYEDQLNAARRWMKEQHFRIGVQHLKAMIDSTEAGRHYSDLAETVLRGLLPAVCQEFARKHGPMPGRGAMVLGMGSLGSGSLTATSDLDLIVIYDAQGQEASVGKRPLAVSTYYARLTQALVTGLTSPMAEGRLYEVDMRLRPSGRKGPVATSLNGFTQYQRDEAWSWEHLALSRARPVAGNPALCQEIETFRREIIAQPRVSDKLLADVADMRARLADAADQRRVANLWETKLGPGRMLDIELLAQTAALLGHCMERSVTAQLQAGQSIDLFNAADNKTLSQAHDRLRRIQQIARLLVDDVLIPENLGQGGCHLLLAETGEDSLEDLKNRLNADQQEVIVMVDQLLGRASS